VVGFTACGWEFEGLVCGFGNEGVVLNEGAGDYSFRPVDSELDEWKRDPLVALLDDAGLAENNLLRYEVMREAVSFTCHEAPPVCGNQVFVDYGKDGWGSDLSVRAAGFRL